MAAEASGSLLGCNNAQIRAVIQRPQLLLADEPTGSLDARAAEAMGELLVMASLWTASAIRIEANLSFIGLGLKDPVNSLGVMLQNVTNTDVLLNYQWHFIPVVFFMALVLAFVFTCPGLSYAKSVGC